MMYKSEKGFTLIELIVAIAIIATLTGIVLANFKSANKSKSVQLGADVVASAIRTAQENSLSPKAVPTLTCAQKIPSEYQLRFDTNISTTFDLEVIDKCGNTVLLQRNTLPQKVRIRPSTGLVVNGLPVNNPMVVKFVPPFGKTQVSSNGGSFLNFGQLAVILEFIDGSNSRQIILDGISGRVDFQ